VQVEVLEHQRAVLPVGEVDVVEVHLPPALEEVDRPGRSVIVGCSSMIS